MKEASLPRSMRCSNSFPLHLRSLSGMGSRVEPQSLLHGKTLVANTALVRHLSGVGSHVDGEAAMGVKTGSSDFEV